MEGAALAGRRGLLGLWTRRWATCQPSAYPGEMTSTTAFQRSIPEELALLGTVPFPSLCLGQALTRPGAVWVWLKGPRDQAGDWGSGCSGAMASALLVCAGLREWLFLSRTGWPGVRGLWKVVRPQGCRGLPSQVASAMPGHSRLPLLPSS